MYPWMGSQQQDGFRLWMHHDRHRYNQKHSWESSARRNRPSIQMLTKGLRRNYRTWRKQVWMERLEVRLNSASISFSLWIDNPIPKGAFAMMLSERSWSSSPGQFECTVLGIRSSPGGHMNLRMILLYLVWYSLLSPVDAWKFSREIYW